MINTEVIVRPLVTEKSNRLAEKARDGVRGGKYSFMVRVGANKTEIKHAIEKLYDVRVIQVATQNRKGKIKRVGMRFGEQSDWKKAIVTVAAEQRIDLF